MIDYDYSELDGFKITIEVGEGYTHSANTIKKLIDANTPLECIIKRPTEAKTHRQLGTAWAAIREMANALGVSQNEMYQKMVREYGKSSLMKVPKEEAERIVDLHTECSEGNQGEIIGMAKDDPNLSVIKLWGGLSSYNKAEMSAFLNGLIREHDEMFGE